MGTLVVDGSPVTEVRYKGVCLTRDRANSAATGLTVTNAAKVLTVAEGVSADGGSAPWAVGRDRGGA